MSRYIEWEWYQKQVKKIHEQHPDVYMPTDGIPFADVREVVRGEWIKFDEWNTVCSLCGYELEDWTQGIFYSYCPNCGADMRDTNS